MLAYRPSKGGTYSLGERSALANGNLVTLNNTESRRNVGGQVLVSLLVSGVLRDVVEVLSSDDDSSVHLGGNNGAGQDTAADGDETSEGALLVYSDSKVQRSAFLYSEIAYDSSTSPENRDPFTTMPSQHIIFSNS